MSDVAATGASTSRHPRAGLGSIARPDGSLAIVAIDQRNTLRKMLAAVDRPTGPEDVRSFKVDVTAALSPAASAVLLDPEFGVPAVVQAGAMAPGCGMLVAAEAAQRDTWRGEPRARRDPTRTPKWVSDIGGQALKLFVEMRPDRVRGPGEPDLVAEVVEVVRAVVEDCAAAGVPSVIESLLYALPGEGPLEPRRRADLIVESARILSEISPDLLKLEYPSDAKGCRAVGEAATVPWAVLSAGVPVEDFLEAVRTACGEGGASGFIAGRVYWKEAVALAGEDRQHFLSTTGRDRLEQSVAAMEGRARPWTEAAEGGRSQ